MAHKLQPAVFPGPSPFKEDFLLETSRATVEMLTKHGFDVVYEESAGGHTWTNWRDYLGEFAPQLFR